MRLGNFIRKANKDSVVEGVRHIKRYYLPNERLVAANSPLERNGISAIKKHNNPTLSYTISDTEFKTYLAGSSLAHILDGWMYLSNAFNSLLNGDSGAAIHLAYYAELRSAMSILATEGIGVFDKKHFGTFDSNDCQIFQYPSRERMKGSTHQFVWNAMEKWSNSAYKPSPEILEIFKVRGRTFFELTEYFHPTTVGSTLLGVQTIKSWLKEWCFDIRSYRDDREERNEVSYRPQRIKNFSQSIDFQNVINELNNYWSVISPSATDKYSLLDTYLLRKLYDGLYSSIGAPYVRRELIQNSFNQHGINDETLFNFLDFQTPYNNDHIIFQQASIRQTTPLSIIARATLLLRISVGLVSQLYNAGGINKNELDFIWNNYAIDNGFWDTENIPADFNNLWTDIQPSLNDLNIDINTPGINNSRFSIALRNHQELLHLGQINRACLWGLDF